MSVSRRVVCVQRDSQQIVYRTFGTVFKEACSKDQNKSYKDRVKNNLSKVLTWKTEPNTCHVTDSSLHKDYRQYKRGCQYSSFEPNQEF